MTRTLPWELPSDLPWRVFTSPVDKWATQPTFVIGEALFIGLALLALWHAKQNGRAHLLCWVAALLAGTANDVIFMAMPLVDNFWQAQATIMLTPRLPLYIPCVYICFLYLPTAFVWRLGLRPLSRAALTGLAAIVFYAPYDIVGARFLWWTWHDSDKPIANRLAGAPLGSTLWVITFAATFAYLLGRAIDRDPAASGPTVARGLALTACLSSLLMVVQMTALQQLDGGVPGVLGLGFVVLLYGGTALWGARSSRPKAPDAPSRVLFGALVFYFVTMNVMMAVFDPASHRSESLHQTYGKCHVEARDITGMTRYEFLCAEDFDEPFSFACAGGPPAEGSSWYTVCGKTDANPWVARGAVLGLGLGGALLYALLLGGLSRGARAGR